MTACAEKKVRRPRRTVSNEDFYRAYHGLPGDEESQKAASDNRNIIEAVLRKYHRAIPADDLESCGLNAMWRTLQYHRDEFGQKFTTSLHRFTDWECKRELRRLRGSKKQRKDHFFVPLFEQHMDLCTAHHDDTAKDEDLEHIRECVELLPHEWMQQVIRQYYFEGLTMEGIGRVNGYSKEAARQKIKKALALLKQICHECLQPDGVLAS